MADFRNILITGASSGLGAALAEAYAAKGVRLFLQGRHAERLNQVMRKAEDKGAYITTKLVDVTSVNEMAAWVLECDCMAPLELVIANAGISAGTGDDGENEAQARAIFGVNLTGVLNTIHPIIPKMKMREHGQIAIMSSLAGFRGIPGAPAYTASKAAVRIYGEALRGELLPFGVGVNVICPGFVKTPMTDVNKFHMPFLMPVEQAAGIIQKGIAENRARIAFPWQMYWAVRAFAAVPVSWSDALLGRLPKKSGQAQ